MLKCTNPLELVSGRAKMLFMDIESRGGDGAFVEVTNPDAAELLQELLKAGVIRAFSKKHQNQVMIVLG